MKRSQRSYRRQLNTLQRSYGKPRSASFSERFWSDASRHVDAVFRDALCLTGSGEAAIDLVVETYRRARRNYRRFLKGHLPPASKDSGILVWLYWNMHGLYCDSILMGSETVKLQSGGML